jgi:hypothetical protein
MGGSIHPWFFVPVGAYALLNGRYQFNSLDGSTEAALHGI